MAWGESDGYVCDVDMLSIPVKCDGLSLAVLDQLLGRTGSLEVLDERVQRPQHGGCGRARHSPATECGVVAKHCTIVRSTH